MSVEQITDALKRARRRNRAIRAEQIATVLRGEQLGQPPVVAAAYAATVRAQAAILTVLNTQIKAMEEQVEEHFGKHPDAKVYLSQPGLGPVLGARVLAEFGDDKQRYADAKARKNYAGTSPITRQSGKRKVVLARWVHNDRLIDALGLQAFCALTPHPARGRTTTGSAPAASDTAPRCASSATVSSAYSTAASRPAPRTTRPRPGTTSTRKILHLPLDN